MRKLFAACLCLGALAAGLAPGAAQASFGIKTLSAIPLNRAGEIEDRAGAHPYEYKLSIDLNLKEDAEETPEGTLSTVIVDLPPGLVGNPLATPRCPRADFEGVIPRCPPNTQIGSAHVSVTVFGPAEVPVYNLVPSPGSPASFGASIFNINSFQEASIRTGGDYGVSVSDLTIPTGLGFQSITESIWGQPSDQSHNPQRWCQKGGVVVEGGCTSESQPLPFLTLPTSCTGPLTTTVHVESLEQPGVVVSKSVQSLNQDGEPAGLRDCEAPPFDPTVSAQTEARTADSPTGLDVNFHIPQTENPEGIATSHLRDTDLTLPKGLTLNPSAAAALAACTPAEADLNAAGPATCPAASKVGTVSVKNPLIFDHPLTGSVYLASQGNNPFGSLFALYIAVEDPLTGIIVKQAVKLEPNPQSGQLRAITAGLPQAPFEDLDFEFNGGPRAPLTTPQSCGTFTTSASLVPWARPLAPVGRSSAFAITAGAGGGACPASEAAAPNAPTFEAGTLTPIAGSYSPFVLKLSRENGSQRIAAIDTTLPKGLVAKLAGIPYCSEAQIAAAAARNQPGQGALELASPSCPLASEVGTVDVGAGSGSPLHVQGHAYLAGPYKGAPLSLVVITPAIAGPFDLGTVVVRAALYVDEETAQVHAVSDPLPTSLAGIPLDVRSIVLAANRPDFMLNPTNCNPMSVLGSATSIAGQAAALSSRFQVGACGALAFKPNLAISLKGGMRRAQHPRLRAVATYPKGEYANTAKLSAILPRSEFIDPAHVANPCTRPQFAAGKCPKGSIIGTVKAFTPLLAEPLEGPVILRSNPEHNLPDLVIALHGPNGTHIQFTGKVNGGKIDFQSGKCRKDDAKCKRMLRSLHTLVFEPKAKYIGGDEASASAVGISGNMKRGGHPALTAVQHRATPEVLKMSGSTRRGGHPALQAEVRTHQGPDSKNQEANISFAQVQLPHSAFLDQAHIKTICTRVQFAAGAGNGTECPKGSIYGSAIAYTPLLDFPLEGNVYLRSSEHPLPDLVVALIGPPSLPIAVDLDGRIDSKNGGIRSTFESVPDAPVTRFVLNMQGGSKGLIINSTNLCSTTNKAKVLFKGQNGKEASSRPAVVPEGCPKKKKGGKGKKGKGKH